MRVRVCEIECLWNEQSDRTVMSKAIRKEKEYGRERLIEKR